MKNTENFLPSVSSVTTDTETSQQTTSSEIEEPVVEPEIDITETANAQLLISQLPQKDLAVFEKINEAVKNAEKAERRE